MGDKDPSLNSKKICVFTSEIQLLVFYCCCFFFFIFSTLHSADNQIQDLADGRQVLCHRATVLPLWVSLQPCSPGPQPWGGKAHAVVKGMTELSRCGNRCGPWCMDRAGAGGTDEAWVHWGSYRVSSGAAVGGGRLTRRALACPCSGCTAWTCGAPTKPRARRSSASL